MKQVWIVLGCAAYVQLVDLPSAFTLNKFYIVGFAVIALAPSPRDLVAENGAARRVQSAWPLRTLQATLLIQYFTAGTCKVFHGDWMSNPDVLWTQVQGVYCTDLAAWLLRNCSRSFWSVSMYGSLAFELFAPVLFCVKRLRWVGIVWGAAFQIGIALTMHELIYFSVQLMAFYVLFVDSNLLRRLSCSRDRS